MNSSLLRKFGLSPNRDKALYVWARASEPLVVYLFYINDRIGRYYEKKDWPVKKQVIYTKEAMKLETFNFKTGDGKNISVYKWPPDDKNNIKGVVQIAHGMAEHASRYEDYNSGQHAFK